MYATSVTHHLCVHYMYKYCLCLGCQPRLAVSDASIASPRHTLSFPSDKSPSTTRCRLLLFRLHVRHALPFVGGDASYTALYRLLLICMPWRHTLQPIIESSQYNIWGRRWYNFYLYVLSIYICIYKCRFIYM